ncbi:MAG: LTA synthase family protein [Clostridia bacterium]|nr:LTA synthase family protein [Clostridia bacterium]MDY5555300.1 LTA synthase family protein [Blautia sp.]
MNITEENEENSRQQKSRGKTIFAFLYFCIVPAAAFYLMEAYEHNAFVEVRYKAAFFNIILFEFIAWVFYLLIGKMHTAIKIVLILAMTFGLINHYVMTFRSTPFVPWDLFSIGTAVSVAGNYDFTPTLRVVIVTLSFVALIILSGKILKKRDRRLARIRLVAAAVVIGGLCFFVNLLQQEEFQKKNRLYPFLFTPTYMTKVNGMAVTFAMDLAYVVVDKPKGYSSKEAEEILIGYESEEDKADIKELPNIIVIMDESFSDLEVLGDLDTNEDYMPFMHRMQKGADNTITGYAQVSVCGGNTANSEFEFLTGNTMAFLPSGSIPYQQYIKKEIPALPDYLKKLGYTTYAQHPYLEKGWNRNKVYPLLGFDHIDFLPDYTEKSCVRKYVSDLSDMQHIINTFEKKETGKPMFLFNITMQNHGGYDDDYTDLKMDIHSGYNSRQLDRYLSLIHLSDQALEYLIDYFSKVDEKTVIVFFGDHQPSDAVTSPVEKNNPKDGQQEDDQTKRYQVPYLVWANYEINGGVEKDTSLNYLAAQVLKAAGVPTDRYQNYLLKLSEKYPVISAAGTTTDKGADDDTLMTYKKLQYYHLFEEKK